MRFHTLFRVFASLLVISIGNNIVPGVEVFLVSDLASRLGQMPDRRSRIQRDQALSQLYQLSDEVARLSPGCFGCRTDEKAQVCTSE